MMIHAVADKKITIKYNNTFILFAIMMFIAEDYICFFDMKSRIYSLNTILLLVWGLYQSFAIKRIKHNVFPYDRLIFLYVLSTLISCCMATLINGEPLGYALLGARQAFIIMLYFPIKFIVNRYGREQITNIILKMGAIVAIALIVQSILYPQIVFINTVSNTRLGRYRTYYFMTITIFNIMFYFSKVFTQKLKYKDIINLVLCFVAFVFVQQTKSAIIAVVMACLFVFIIEMSKGKIRYKIIIILATSLLIYCGKNYLYGQYLEAIDTINEAARTITGNVGIRIRTIEFIMDSVKNHSIFGLGYYYGGWDSSNYITGWAYGYAMGDVGFFQQLFHVGYVGLIISALILIKLTANIYKLDKKDNYLYFGKLILIYMILVSVFNYYFTSDTMLVYLCIYMAIFDEPYNGGKQKCNQKK